MTRTEFQQSNKDFDSMAHLAAERILYPVLLGTHSTLCFRDMSMWGDGCHGISDAQKNYNRFFDGSLGIDWIVDVRKTGYRDAIVVTVQERFRRIMEVVNGYKRTYADYRDLTITEWNNASGKKSELHKLFAHVFLYGYYNEETDDFFEAIAVDIPKLMQLFSCDSITHSRDRNPKGQDFVSFKFDDLVKFGTVMMHYRCPYDNVSTTY